MRGLKFLLIGIVRVGLILALMHGMQVIFMSFHDDNFFTMVQMITVFALIVMQYARLLILATDYIGK